MTDNQDLDQLTDEQKQLIATLPRDMQRTALRTLLKAGKNDAAKVAAEIREAIAPGGKVEPQQMWAPCAAMPSDLCRVSPFFPMAKASMKPRPYLEDCVITKSSWGKIEFSGPKLSVDEESVLLAALSLIDQGAPGTSYRGPLLPILKAMGYDKVGGANYQRVIKALEMLVRSTIKLTVSRKAGKKSKLVFFTNIISSALWDEDKGELYVSVNEHFHELFAKGGMTLIDLPLRSSIKSQIGKALFRFIQSQAKPLKLHFLTLAAALNLDMEQPQYQIRRQLKAALTELKKHEILTTNSGFTGRDLVSLERTPESKTRRRLTALPPK